MQFCKSHLGLHDGVITLIDEEGEEYETIYLARKNGLSGGWMGFAVAHNLAYGDTLVFELVRRTAFKVSKPVSYLPKPQKMMKLMIDVVILSGLHYKSWKLWRKLQRYELIMSGIWI